MSGSEVLLAGLTALLMVVGCSPQDIPIDESSPYFNADRPNADLPKGNVEELYQTFNGGVAMPPAQFIGRPIVHRKFDKNDKTHRYPEYVGHFVPILQQSFDISPEGSYTFSYQFADGTQRQESGGLRYPAVQDEPNRFGTGFIYGEGINKFQLYIFNESAPYKPYRPYNRPL